MLNKLQTCSTALNSEPFFIGTGAGEQTALAYFTLLLQLRITAVTFNERRGTFQRVCLCDFSQGAIRLTVSFVFLRCTFVFSSFRLIIEPFISGSLTVTCCTFNQKVAVCMAQQLVERLAIFSNISQKEGNCRFFFLGLIHLRVKRIFKTILALYLRPGNDSNTQT